MRASGYVVIYLWRGERHRALDGPFSLRAKAEELAALYRSEGFRAWVEEF